MRMLCLGFLLLLPFSALAQDAGDNIDSGLASAPRMVKHLHQHGVNIQKGGNVVIHLYKGKAPAVILDDSFTFDQIKTYDSWDWSYNLNPIEVATDLGSELAGLAQTYPQNMRKPVEGLGNFLHDLHLAVAQ